MKKITFTLFAVLALTGFSIGQVIPNGDFEDWTGGLGYEDPDNFATYNVFSIAGGVPGFPLGVTKSTDAHGGSFAAKLTTIAANPDFTSNVQLGNIFPKDTIAAFLYAGTLDNPTIPVTAKPISINFFYKFSSPGDDAGAAFIQTIKGASTVTGQALAALTPNTAYEFVNADITYLNPADTSGVDKIVVIFLSSLSGLASFGLPISGPQVPGSTLLVDDMTISSDAGSSVNDISASKLTVKLFPNPANTELTVASSGYQFGNGNLTISFYDMTGRKLHTHNLTSAFEKVDVSAIPSGMYLYTVSNNQNILRTGKFSVSK